MGEMEARPPHLGAWCSQGAGSGCIPPPWTGDRRPAWVSRDSRPLNSLGKPPNPWLRVSCPGWYTWRLLPRRPSRLSPPGLPSPAAGSPEGPLPHPAGLRTWRASPSPAVAPYLVDPRHLTPPEAPLPSRLAFSLVKSEPLRGSHCWPGNAPCPRATCRLLCRPREPLRPFASPRHSRKETGDRAGLQVGAPSLWPGLS